MCVLFCIWLKNIQQKQCSDYQIKEVVSDKKFDELGKVIFIGP